MGDVELVIKIPEAVYKASQIIDVKHEDTVQIPLEVIKNGIPLPKEATNGDMIKAVFPNAEVAGVEGLEGFQCVAVSIGLGTSYFALEWWNAPFKTEKWINFAEELKDIFEDKEE